MYIYLNHGSRYKHNKLEKCHENYQRFVATVTKIIIFTVF